MVYCLLERSYQLIVFSSSQLSAHLGQADPQEIIVERADMPTDRRCVGFNAVYRSAIAGWTAAGLASNRNQEDGNVGATESGSPIHEGLSKTRSIEHSKCGGWDSLGSSDHRLGSLGG